MGGCPQGTSHDIITITEDITLSEALPAIRGTITIEGNGHTISGDDKFRIFDVGSGGRLTLKGLTLSDGYLNGNGGAIRLRNGATLTVENSTFIDNWAYRGGVIAMVSGDVAATISRSSFESNQSELEGGVFLLHGGTATISKSSFVDNNAERAWGGVFHAQGSRLSVTNSTFKGNQGLAGGVLANMSGSASFTHVTLIDNKSYYLGGDAFYRYGGLIALRKSLVSNRGPINDCDRGLNVSEGNLSKDGTCSALPISDLKLGSLTGEPAYLPLRDGSPALDAAIGDYCPATDQIGTPRPPDKCDIGAIESATAELAATPVVPPPPCPLFDRIVAANTDAPSGGCEAGDGHDIIKLTEDIALEAPLPRITSAITIEGNGHTLSGGSRFRIFSVDGGALTINNLTLTKGRVAANAKGGALMVQNGGQVTINDSRFSENVAKEGGAIWMSTANTRVTVNNSNFINNSAENLGVGGAIDMSDGRLVISSSSFIRNSATAAGGAIATWRPGEVVINNSTFSGNRAETGGAVHSGGAPVILTHVTMVDNFAADGAALHSIDIYPGRIRLRNSIVQSVDPGRFVNCSGQPMAESLGNLVNDDSCGTSTGADPALGELTGEPAWHPLAPGSPAINAAHAAYCPEKDQAGAARPQGGGCDIGAIEWSASRLAQSDSSASPQGMSACTVTTTHVLNFRDGPGGNRIGLVAQRAALTAKSRTASWFQVEYRGLAGWISADYVVTQGECG